MENEPKKKTKRRRMTPEALLLLPDHREILWEHHLPQSPLKLVHEVPSGDKPPQVNKPCQTPH